VEMPDLGEDVGHSDRRSRSPPSHHAGCGRGDQRALPPYPNNKLKEIYLLGRRRLALAAPWRRCRRGEPRLGPEKQQRCAGTVAGGGKVGNERELEITIQLKNSMATKNEAI
jgi:hypothetical protein